MAFRTDPKADRARAAQRKRQAAKRAEKRRRRAIRLAYEREFGEVREPERIPYAARGDVASTVPQTSAPPWLFGMFARLNFDRMMRRQERLEAAKPRED